MKKIIFLIILINSHYFYSQEDNSLIGNTIRELGIDTHSIKLTQAKENPSNKDETIIVIAERVEEISISSYTVNSYIIIVNTKTGKIIQQYFEDYKENGWHIDSEELQKIKIDTAPYLLTENTRAFGVRLEYVGSSKPNPYKTTLSLYVRNPNTLKKVLSNYVVEETDGQWDPEDVQFNCSTDYVDKRVILIMKNSKTNGYFDILAKNKISTETYYTNENNECAYQENSELKYNVLKYTDGEYK
ncbi:hypothetical protein [Cellulophaga sp. HaHa_2_1]|uniref:hypothetical protein n=1 Tax=Cellulophaga sp. HaHa_2_1 TaxID=2749994 RepID=UPI001C4E3330|nr:hypothetical protein [Cellulophaga sp. HaHa_2_1]QXP54150.1 hypothetical protein H0I24_09575 [Cellulophaga sp. HaHa_2_1]